MIVNSACNFIPISIFFSMEVRRRVDEWLLDFVEYNTPLRGDYFVRAPIYVPQPNIH